MCTPLWSIILKIRCHSDCKSCAMDVVYKVHTYFHSFHFKRHYTRHSTCMQTVRALGLRPLCCCMVRIGSFRSVSVWLLTTSIHTLPFRTLKIFYWKYNHTHFVFFLNSRFGFYRHFLWLSKLQPQNLFFVCLLLILILLRFVAYLFCLRLRLRLMLFFWF